MTYFDLLPNIVRDMFLKGMTEIKIGKEESLKIMKLFHLVPKSMPELCMIFRKDYAAVSVWKEDRSLVAEFTLEYDSSVLYYKIYKGDKKKLYQFLSSKAKFK